MVLSGLGVALAEPRVSVEPRNAKHREECEGLPESTISVANQN
jgi:hypothetical protein